MTNSTERQYILYEQNGKLDEQQIRKKTAM